MVSFEVSDSTRTLETRPKIGNTYLSREAIVTFDKEGGEFGRLGQPGVGADML